MPTAENAPKPGAKNDAAKARPKAGGNKAQPAPKAAGKDPFRKRDAKAVAAAGKSLVHMIRPGIRCGTEKRGNPTPRGDSRFKIRVDASEGFVPLWDEGVTLRWRFQERSMQYFEDPDAAADAIEELFGEGVDAWGDACPVRFSRRNDAWDFEIVMSASDDCDPNGCVLASAFFPDPGRHELWMYPRMFTQTREEQVETLVHEIDHVFGLRHFFANVTEKRWRSELFGKDNPFSIMNYGRKSVLTPDDRDDLRRLYDAAWSGELTDVNGTEIRLVLPFHQAGEPTWAVARAAAAAVEPPRAHAASIAALHGRYNGLTAGYRYRAGRGRYLSQR